MEIIAEEKLWSFSEGGLGMYRKCFNIRRDGACKVKSFIELATKVAHLQFKNPNYVMLFRGQGKDYQRTNMKDVSFTSLAPSLFRADESGNPRSYELQQRFERLKEAELLLVEKYAAKKYPEVDRLKRQQILRWAILQHYEVCATPLLDVTHSLRIAASFASHRAHDEAFVFVLGVPHLSGVITASAEAGIQIVRLSSVCPPTALRPHIQEGYLLGEYPEMSGYDQKQHYAHFEIDFGRRLVAKFRFNPKVFWAKNDAFPAVDRDALYPDANDELFTLARSIRRSLNPNH